MPNFENAFNTVCELVKDFKENEHRYLSPQYQEAEVRRDFIDKLFEALGWDVYHRTQKNPYEQEVKVEKGVSIGKAQKRADYAFYINPEYRQPKFFAEAKKPSRSLKNADDYFQTIRYGWNSNTPIAVLSDFEEFHVLDCRYKPNLKTVLDNPNHKSYRYADYTNKEIFKEIYYLFSRDDVEKNSLEKYSEAFAKIKGKGKTTFKSIIKTIDDDFLEYIDEVRETLAKAFKKNDSKLSSEELTEATQRTIDRIVFIRFLEDKLIEPEYYISEFGKKGNAWNEFISVCRKLDAKYNGIVFKKHFIDEQNFQGPEQNTFKKICDEMSYLNSPYDFNAIPIHILGSIYERFLGKVVNATAQRVKVEEKPEVRKAGGVYYTPKYIVDYIVENTVGKILRNEESSGRSGILPDDSLKDCPTETIGKTPAEISKLRFADIACGSGSFLIGVFETLLKYHTEYYQLHPEQAKKDGCINKDGLWILSIKQKQSILLNNIYGVDIDNQAVEVTQLSLALKMLEDETGGTANDMQNMFHEKILPDLSKNIICGNSLIGTDILHGKMFPTEEERKLNPMDFEKRFSEVMRNGGFDVIVGNPPYLGRATIFSDMEKEYIKVNYKCAEGKYETFHLFIEKSISLLRENGYFSFITPQTWLTILQATKLRKKCVESCNFISILNIRKLVFSAAVNTIIFVLKKGVSDKGVLIFEYKNSFHEDIKQPINVIQNKDIICNEDFLIDIFGNNDSDVVKNKILESTIKLESLCFVKDGVKVVGPAKDFAFSKTKSDESFFPMIIGKDIHRYYYNWSGYFNCRDKNKIVKHNATDIRLREEFIFKNPKIIVRKTGNEVIAAIDREQYYYEQTLFSIALIDISSVYSLEYILGVLSSKISKYLLNSNPFSNKDLFPQIRLHWLKEYPIKELDFSNSKIKQSHDKIVSLVKQMLETKKQLKTIKTDRDKTYYENKCADLDNAIDSEVYKLYGLTPEEIKIVVGREEK